MKYINSLLFNFYKLLFFIFILILFVCIFFIPIISTNYEFSTFTGEYIWPLPGYTRISSPFGKRTAPTSGASTYHKGIDIPAPVGTPLIATADGTISFTGFLGGGGYTITLSVSESIKITYCHVSPNYIVTKGDFVKQGTVIGHIGPKNVYGVIGNPYKDSNGNPTNGATTGPHLHLGFRINNTYQNPLEFISFTQ